MALNAHWLIVKTAKEMANELFEVYARDNETYRVLRERGEVTEKVARRKFVNRVAPKLYEEARQTLVKLLAEPEERVTLTMKDTIHEALVADNMLRANRQVAKERAVLPKWVH